MTKFKNILHKTNLIFNFTILDIDFSVKNDHRVFEKKSKDTFLTFRYIV